MSDTRSDSLPPVDTNPNPADGTPLADTDPGITPKAANMVSGFGDLWALVFVTLPGAISRGWAWANKTPARRRANAAFAFVLLVALAVISLTTGDKKVVPQPQPATTVQGLHHEVVATDDNLAAIGKPYGVTRQEMIDANIGLVVKYTNEVCPKLDRPATYFAGFLTNGKTKRDGTYCQFTDYKGKNPTYIGTKLAQDSVRPKDDALVPCTTKSTPLIPECRQVADNVQ